MKLIILNYLLLLGAVNATERRFLQLSSDPKTVQVKPAKEQGLQGSSIPNHEPETIKIEINKETSLISDIVSISHMPSAAMIKIELNKTRTCLKPVFRSRLSGPSLAILKWEKIDLEKHELIGHYNVPYAGKYFFEIIALLCNELEYYQDFQSVCVEDILHHRITADDSTIDVVQINQQTDEMGAWVYAPAHQDQQYVPLYTRIQPDVCVKGLEHFINSLREPHNIPPMIVSPHLSDHEANQCDKYSDIRPFESYHFQWHEHVKKDLMLHNGTKKICFIGKSHSRFFFEAVVKLRGESESSASISLAHHDEVTESTWDEILNDNKCKRIVFGIGQWPAGFPRGRPTLLHEYWRDTESLIHDVISKREMMKALGADVYFRSIHLIPLQNHAAGSCPAVDWRTPPVIDGYNSILRELCRIYHVPFLDTDFLIGPVWDSSQDWSHVNPDIALVEAQYVIAQTSLHARNSILDK